MEPPAATSEPIEPVRTVIPLTEPAAGTPSVVDTDAALSQTTSELAAGTGPIAIDAERAGGYRYSQGAYLIQLRRTGSGTHLIDPLPFVDLAALSSEISGAEWILHAASQDIPCLTAIGMVPSRLFDTELAGRLLGRPRVGLAALTESELGFSLAKEHSAADWSTRPLPDTWLRYAALDVELLIELRDIMEQELAACGRLEWARQEFDHVRVSSIRPPRTDPWRRTSGIHRIRSTRQLAIIRELWVTRDQLAEANNIAPGRVLPDAAIAAAAAAKPKDRAALASLSAFAGRGAKRRLDTWWSAVQRAMTMTDDELPAAGGPTDGPPPPRTWPDRSPAAATRLTMAREAMTELSESLNVAPENLLTPDTVRRLCWSPPQSVSIASVEEFLAANNARAWQIELTSNVLTKALADCPTGVTPG